MIFVTCFFIICNVPYTLSHLVDKFSVQKLHKYAIYEYTIPHILSFTMYSNNSFNWIFYIAFHNQVKVYLKEVFCFKKK